MSFKKPASYLPFLLVAILLYFPVFLHLSSYSLRLWDESRLACNAYEMIQNGNFLVPHFNNQPDMWSTKPPLMIWLQVAGIKLFGVNELAVRLPAALAVAFTLLLIFWFCAKFLKNSLLGLCSVLVLVTLPGYLQDHCGRTGDYDALLVLFTTLYSMAFFIFAETGKTKYLYFSLAGVALAVLTKGISGLFFLPVLAGYSFYKKSAGRILKNKHFYFASLLFLILTCGYYLLREWHNPGYLKTMLNNEITGRYLDTLENHRQPFGYYLNNLFSWQAGPWLFFLPLAAVLLIYFKKNISPEIRKFTLVSFASLLFLLLILSAAGTKLSWYIAPAYPFLAIIAALPVAFIIEFFCNIEVLKNPVRRYFVVILILTALFAHPYMKAVEYAGQKEKDCWPPHRFGYFMNRCTEQKKYIVSCHGYNASVQFHAEIQKSKGFNVLVKKVHELTPGDTVMVCENEIIKNIENRFNVSLVKSQGECKMVAILGKKQEFLTEK